MLYPVSRLLVAILIKPFIKKVHGEENIIRNSPFILACNHSSYFDDIIIPAIVMPIIDKKMHFYVSSNYFNNRITRAYLNHYEAIPIDTKKGKKQKQTNKKAFDAALTYLKKDEFVVIFPEGARTLTGKIQKGKTGVARLALGAKVPVIPIGIKGTFDLMPKGKIIPKFKKSVIVSVGKPIYFDKYYKMKATKKLFRQLTDEVMKEIAKLSGQEYNP